VLGTVEARRSEVVIYPLHSDLCLASDVPRESSGNLVHRPNVLAPIDPGSGHQSLTWKKRICEHKHLPAPPHLPPDPPDPPDPHPRDPDAPLPVNLGKCGVVSMVGESGESLTGKKRICDGAFHGPQNGCG